MTRLHNGTLVQTPVYLQQYTCQLTSASTNAFLLAPVDMALVQKCSYGVSTQRVFLSFLISNLGVCLSHESITTDTTLN